MTNCYYKTYTQGNRSKFKCSIELNIELTLCYPAFSLAQWLLRLTTVLRAIPKEEALQYRDYLSFLPLSRTAMQTEIPLHSFYKTNKT